MNQDAAGQPATPFASVSSDESAATFPYRAVLDGFSLHLIRSVAPDFSGGTCGDDSSAIGQRMDDVFAWMGVPPSGLAACDLPLIPTDTPPEDAPPARTVLFHNTPNPFNPRTTVRYDLAHDAEVTLQIFDVTGKLVRTLVDAPQNADRYTVEWDGTTDTGTHVASGVFWTRMSTSRDFRASTKMVVLK